VRTQRRRRPFVAKLALVLVVATVLPATLFALPAGAEKPPDDDCDYGEPGQLVSEELFDGTLVYWECIKTSPTRGRWKIWGIIPGPERGNLREFSSSSPPYRSILHAGIGTGNSNGVAVVAYDLANPDDTPLRRRIAVRLEIHNRTTGVRCINGVWHETTGSDITFEALLNLPARCGGGYYEVAAAGRFFSVSLNRWIENYWVRSGQLYFPPICCRAEGPAKRPS